MDLAKFYANERVGVADMADAGGQLAFDDEIRKGAVFELPSGRAGSTGQDARVFSGFDVVGSPVGTNSLTISRGAAICKVLDGGELKHGVLMGGEGSPSITLDLTSLGDGTYYVWARFVQHEAVVENRVFWNPLGSPAQEYVDNVATRKVAAWQIVAQSSSATAPPGHGEYFRIWTVTKSGGTISAVTDTRNWFFEGAADDAYSHEWGDGANDRDADRSAHGVQDWHLWAQMIRRQLADVIGSPVGAHTVWPAVPIELEQLATGHWAEADGVAKRGKHKDFYFGGTGSNNFWFAYTLTSGGAESVGFAPDPGLWGANVPEFICTLGEIGAGPARQGTITVAPWGSGVTGPQENNEICGITWWGTDGLVEEIQAFMPSGEVRKEWKHSGVTLMSLDTDSGVDYGLKVHTGNIDTDGIVYSQGGFHTQSQIDVYVPLPWSAIVPDAAGSRLWQMTGPTTGDVGITGVYIESLGSISGSNPIFFEFIDFPDGATLLAIDVIWAQAGVGAGNQMRMFAGRHVNISGRPADTHAAGQDISGFEWVPQILNSVNNYVEYALITNPSQVRRFKPDSNNTAWDRRKHKLVIGILPPATTAQTLRIHQILTLWRYEKVNPWGITTGW